MDKRQFDGELPLSEADRLAVRVSVALTAAILVLAWLFT